MDTYIVYDDEANITFHAHDMITFRAYKIAERFIDSDGGDLIPESETRSKNDLKALFAKITHDEIVNNVYDDDFDDEQLLWAMQNAVAEYYNNMKEKNEMKKTDYTFVKVPSGTNLKELPEGSVIVTDLITEAMLKEAEFQYTEIMMNDEINFDRIPDYLEAIYNHEDSVDRFIDVEGYQNFILDIAKDVNNILDRKED